MKKELLVVISLILVVCGVAVYQYVRFSDGRLHILFCDVGQGDAIYIRTPKGFDIIVDGGPDATVLDCLARHRPFWDREIELMFATHPDADHITGLVEVLKRFHVRSVNTSHAESETEIFHEFISQITVEKADSRHVYSRDSFKTPDGVYIQQLWPTYSRVQTPEEQSANSQSLIQLFRYGDFELMLTGDADVEEVNQALSRLPDVDILKLSHHGSRTGTDMMTFQNIRPNLAIISLGAKNRFGHPHNEVIHALEHSRIPFKRTDLHGDVEIITDGKNITVVTER